MKIEAITLREIHMPLVHFFETSFGRIYSRRILLLTAHCDGVNGWGECVAGEDPFYCSEWTESAWLTIARYLAPAVIGRDPRFGARLHRSFLQGARAPHGQGRAGKRFVGCRGETEKHSLVETAGRHAD